MSHHCVAYKDPWGPLRSRRVEYNTTVCMPMSPGAFCSEANGLGCCLIKAGAHRIFYSLNGIIWAQERLNAFQVFSKGLFRTPAFSCQVQSSLFFPDLWRRMSGCTFSHSSCLLEDIHTLHDAVLVCQKNPPSSEALSTLSTHIFTSNIQWVWGRNI